MESERTPVVALMGNPNVGKSTVFNALTGARQHTGNWSGKTVSGARGTMHCGGREMTLVDLPGTYSLRPRSAEERVARDFLAGGEADAAVLVADATCLERNLILILQVLELLPNVVVCLNLMDEARKKRIHIDIPALERELGVPVVPCAARRGRGLPSLTQAVCRILNGETVPHPTAIRYSAEIEQAIRASGLARADALAALSDCPPEGLSVQQLDDFTNRCGSAARRGNRPDLRAGPRGCRCARPAYRPYPAQPPVRAASHAAAACACVLHHSVWR